MTLPLARLQTSEWNLWDFVVYMTSFAVTLSIQGGADVRASFAFTTVDIPHGSDEKLLLLRFLRVTSVGVSVEVAKVPSIYFGGEPTGTATSTLFRVRVFPGSSLRVLVALCQFGHVFNLFQRLWLSGITRGFYPPQQSNTLRCAIKSVYLVVTRPAQPTHRIPLCLTPWGVRKKKPAEIPSAGRKIR